MRDGREWLRSVGGRWEDIGEQLDRIVVIQIRIKLQFTPRLSSLSVDIILSHGVPLGI